MTDTGALDPADLDRAAERLATARRIVILTGAGVSAESGIPTFRGADGLWKNHAAEDLATPLAFARNPELVWEWYDWRRGIIATKEPNEGHRALSELERLSPSFTLVTQNVDRLHQRAGSRELLELHGSIWDVRCTRCTWYAEDLRVPLPRTPSCVACGALARPGVVWFGESLSPDVLGAAFDVSLAADVFVVAGTSAVVQPAASLASEAKRRGAWLVEVNPAATPLSPLADALFRGPSGDVLPRLVARVRERRGVSGPD